VCPKAVKLGSESAQRNDHDGLPLRLSHLNLPNSPRHRRGVASVSFGERCRVYPTWFASLVATSIVLAIFSFASAKRV
jgi:hypothetical protein